MESEHERKVSKKEEIKGGKETRGERKGREVRREKGKGG